MPARGWHQDPQVTRCLGEIRANGVARPRRIPMAMAQVQTIRILCEVSEALERGASELRVLARRAGGQCPDRPAVRN